MFDEEDSITFYDFLKQKNNARTEMSKFDIF